VPAHGTAPRIVRVVSPTRARVRRANTIVFTPILYRPPVRTLRVQSNIDTFYAPCHRLRDIARGHS
jgi:hypothetical protein